VDSLVSPDKWRDSKLKLTTIASSKIVKYPLFVVIFLSQYMYYVIYAIGQNRIIIIQFNSSMLYLFKCLLNSPKANYEASTSRRKNKPNTQIKSEQGNLHRLDNNKNNSILIYLCANCQLKMSMRKEKETKHKKK
jgi:hypothetical protein